MILLLQMASRFVGGMAFAIIFTIVLAIAIRYFAKRERNKRLIRLPRIKGVDRSRRRMEVANRRRSHN
jgi:Na+-transporting methylmalonyl-CoA/oxaloacetate decarboxylase gamma subunit